LALFCRCVMVLMLGPDTRASGRLKKGYRVIDATGSHQKWWYWMLLVTKANVEKDYGFDPTHARTGFSFLRRKLRTAARWQHTLSRVVVDPRAWGLIKT